MSDSTYDNPEGAVPSDARLRRIERLSHLLDDSINVPGIDYRIGYDALIGLVPGVGDAAGLLLSTYIVFEAGRLGVSKTTLARMTFNVALEALIGVVPLLGDLFDATWKANLRNIDLLHGELDLKPRRRRLSNRSFLIVIGLALLLVLGFLGGLIWGMVVLLQGLT